MKIHNLPFKYSWKPSTINGIKDFYETIKIQF